MSPRHPQRHSSISPRWGVRGRCHRHRHRLVAHQISIHQPNFRVPHRADALSIVHRPLQYLPSSDATLGGAGLSVVSSWSTPLRVITAPAAGSRSGHDAASRGQKRTARAISVAAAALYNHARVDEPLHSVVLLQVHVLVILVATTHPLTDV